MKKDDPFWYAAVVSSLLCVILTTRGRPVQNVKQSLKRY